MKISFSIIRLNILYFYKLIYELRTSKWIIFPVSYWRNFSMKLTYFPLIIKPILSWNYSMLCLRKRTNHCYSSSKMSSIPRWYKYRLTLKEISLWIEIIRSVYIKTILRSLQIRINVFNISKRIVEEGWNINWSYQIYFIVER
jgi:hypothetical protein